MFLQTERGQPDKLNPEIEKYLDLQLGADEVRGGVLGRGGEKRRSSCASDVTSSVSSSLSGSMKRSRSICPDQSLVKEIQRQVKQEQEKISTIPEETSSTFSRQSPTSEKGQQQQQQQQQQFIKSVVGGSRRTRFESESGQFVDTEAEDLVDMLRSTSSDMETQGDILHYMAGVYGMMHQTSIGVIRDLIR